MIPMMMMMMMMMIMIMMIVTKRCADLRSLGFLDFHVPMGLLKHWFALLSLPSYWCAIVISNSVSQSVSLSVCLSVHPMLTLCQSGCICRQSLFTYSRALILVFFLLQMPLQNRMVTHSKAALNTWYRINLRFRPKSPFISETVRDGP